MPTLDYVRKRFLPHIWCPGCGHGIITANLLRAIEELGLPKDGVVMASGIGCSSRIVGYLDFHTLHTLHGRALAFATGVKLAKPELKVIVPMGDGDAVAIGGNHFIHACARNIDLTAIIMNNSTYGMTGGQASPMTGYLERSTTTPYGNHGHPFDIVKLAIAAGATYVARSTTYHPQQMIKLFKRAIEHKGFSVVEVFSQCPTYYGRTNRKGDAVEMMSFYKEHAVKAGSDAKAEDPFRFEIGEFVCEDRPEFCQGYAEMAGELGEAER
ncbi:MAG: 2-oxoacid:ferredoxin oxidoreductase subunit beta [Myxococcota bacterium]|jgi:2-oxoglutarate ferredoxin oxidoreductase subunit beta|nr:2-oxoacid:ferredoxin oxidoreductase subunit beta [Myxococcota bacterium]